MDVKTAAATYRDYQKKIRAYGHASGVLTYDKVTGAPKGAEAGVSETLEVLNEASYRLETSKELLDAVDYLYEHRDVLDRIMRREIEEYMRGVEYIKSIPEDEYMAFMTLTNEASDVWHKAKNDNDYESFKPYLQKIFDTQRKFALYYKHDRDPYDTLLDFYERGLTKNRLDDFFGALKSSIVPLIARISNARPIEDGFMHGHFPVDAQRRFSDYLMQVMCIDRDRCSIDETEHPFTENFGKNDVRITTHYYDNDFTNSMYSVVHEGGHALYELGSGDEYEHTNIAGGASMAMHETISRFYENIIGRSRPFCGLILPKVRELFPQFENVSDEEFYRACNVSRPSLIRMEADELTYALHIIVRYEIERDMIDGAYKTDEIPRVWREKYKEYLGVDVPDDKHGVLQDSHWSGGSVGYFPTYALGSAYGAQILHKMKEDVDVDEAVKSGSTRAIHDWLGEHIFRHSAMYDPDELLRMCTGESFDPKYFIDYLTSKYSKLYGLS